MNQDALPAPIAIPLSRRDFLKAGAALGLGCGLSYLLRDRLPNLARQSPPFALTSVLSGNIERFSQDHGALYYRDLVLHTPDLAQVYPLHARFPVIYQPNKSRLYDLAYAAGFACLAYLIPYFLTSPESFRRQPLGFRLAASGLIGLTCSNLLGQYLNMAIEDSLEQRLGPGVAAVGLKNPDSAVIYKIGTGNLLLAQDFELSEVVAREDVRLAGAEVAYRRTRLDVRLALAGESQRLPAVLYLLTIPSPGRGRASFFSAVDCARDPRQLVLSAQPPAMAAFAGMPGVQVYGHHKNPLAGLVTPDEVQASNPLAWVYRLYEMAALNIAMHTAPNLLVLQDAAGRPLLAGPLSWASTGAISYGQRLVSQPILSPTLFMGFVGKTGVYDAAQARCWSQAAGTSTAAIQDDLLRYEAVWQAAFTQPTTEENRTPHPTNQRLMKLDPDGRIEILPAGPGAEQFIRQARQQPASLSRPESTLVRPGAVIYPGETPPEDRLDLVYAQKCAVNLALLLPEPGSSFDSGAGLAGRLLGFMTLSQSVRLPIALLVRLADQALAKAGFDPQQIVKIYLDEHTAGGIEAAGPV